ncbi:MAG TPA: glycosyltransferase family protein [Anaerolineales bacterium]|nr:glycosyltransferase family protein [Anaerolineales bacterium]
MMPRLPLTIALIQARMGSKRLPNKVLADLNGRPMLQWVLERTKRAKSVDKVAVVTSTNPGDDVIEQFCNDHGYACFRGDEQDVLDRYYQAAKAFNAFIIVRVTGDCPFIDPGLINRTVQLLWGAFGATSIAFTPPNDFTANRLPTAWGRTYPIGLDVEVCTFSALEKAWKEAKETYQREHVMPYLYEHNDRFKTLVLNHDKNLSHYRWTVDTAEDLEFARQVASHFPNDAFTWTDILALLEREPELTNINAHVAQKTFKDVDER